MGEIETHVFSLNTYRAYGNVLGLNETTQRMKKCTEHSISSGQSQNSELGRKLTCVRQLGIL